MKANKETIDCDECGSDFYLGSLKMGGLCPECAHHIYGFVNCEHSFKEGRCSKCYWNGSSSAYIDSIKNDS